MTIIAVTDHVFPVPGDRTVAGGGGRPRTALHGNAKTPEEVVSRDRGRARGVELLRADARRGHRAAR